MNMTPSEAVALVNELKPLVANEDVDVVFCVPAIDIILLWKQLKAPISVSEPRTCTMRRRALIQARFLPTCWVDAGVKYVIIGHSERREYFAETDETVNKKGVKGL